MAHFESITALGSNAVWTSDVRPTQTSDFLAGVAISDQAGTLFVEQSGNGGTNWDISTSYPVVANTAKVFSEPLYLSIVRLRYVNGGVAQGSFRIFSRSTSTGFDAE